MLITVCISISIRKSKENKHKHEHNQKPENMHQHTNDKTRGISIPSDCRGQAEPLQLGSRGSRYSLWYTKNAAPCQEIYPLPADPAADPHPQRFTLTHVALHIA